MGSQTPEVSRTKYLPWDAAEAGAPPPTVALVPAGGELWEDFLDTIGLPLERFCREGPGGWMLGYIEALACVGLRTAVIFVSARVQVPTRWRNPSDGSLLIVLPAPRGYVRGRGRLPTYRQVLTGQTTGGALRRLLGAAQSHRSTPLRLMRDELRRLGCTAIIAQEYDYFRFDACLLLGRLLSVPVLATFQGSTHEPNVLSRAWKPRLVRRARALVIPAEAEAARVRAHYGEGVRIARVFNPLNLRSWTPLDRSEARRRLGVDAGTRLAVWHGRIAMYSKGLDLLVEAWRRIVAARPGADLRLMMIGTGEDAAAFARLLAEADLASIDWRDEYVTDSETIRALLSAGDVYAFPSRLEGFPLAPVEAMACGLPVVAAGASGTSEILDGGRRGGLLVPPEDVDAFSRELGRLLDDPQMARRLGADARSRVEEAVSVEAVGRQLADLLTPTARGDA